MTTRAEAIAAAGQCLAEARALADSLPPDEAARLAWTPTSPYSVDELAEQIRARRAATTTSRSPRTPLAGSGDTAPAGLHGGGTGRGATKTA